MENWRNYLNGSRRKSDTQSEVIVEAWKKATLFILRRWGSLSCQELGVGTTISKI